MAAVTVTNVRVGNNPAAFSSPLVFDIQYQCHYNLQEDLEWKLLYVGSAESQQYDQLLDSVLVGPVQPGSFQFTFEADPPNASDIPPDDVVGVTVILLTCSYKDKEFIRIGYYVNNEYMEPELQESPPDNPIIERLQRNILANKPRVTRFPHNFDQEDAAAQQMQQLDPSAHNPAQPFDSNPDAPQNMVKAMQQEILQHQQHQQMLQSQQAQAQQMAMQQQQQMQAAGGQAGMPGWAGGMPVTTATGGDTMMM